MVADQVGLEPTILGLTGRSYIPLKLLILLVGPGGLEPLPLGRDLQSRCRIRTTFSPLIICTPYRDRTCDLLYVRQPLLPSELRVCLFLQS